MTRDALFCPAHKRVKLSFRHSVLLKHIIIGMNGDGAESDDFVVGTVVALDAHRLNRQQHTKRLPDFVVKPLLLELSDQFGAWLDGSAGTETLIPAAEDAIRYWPVSKRINKVSTPSDKTLIEPIELAA